MNDRNDIVHVRLKTVEALTLHGSPEDLRKALSGFGDRMSFADCSLRRSNIQSWATILDYGSEAA